MMDKDDSEFNAFINLMLKKMDDHQTIYGDSWKQMSTGKIFDRLKNKFNEFDLTYNKDKLLSISNLSMLLYIRMKEESEKTKTI